MLVFDLDQTVIDSRHRTPLNSNGKVDIPKYVLKQTKKHINRDKIMPLAALLQEEYKKQTYIIICTARKMTQYDYDFLKRHNINYHEIYERGNVPAEIASLPDALYKMHCLKKYKDVNYTFYDDSSEVINLFKNYSNVNMIDSIEKNKLMAQNLVNHGDQIHG
tara:strand:+ start:6837 stop:7325 length:489 start_codon:yes stop_codon:yes gene_type:complete